MFILIRKEYTDTMQLKMRLYFLERSDFATEFRVPIWTGRVVYKCKKKYS